MTKHDPLQLTPMQEGMLFHSLSAPHSGVNIEQVTIDLPESIDAAALRRAWQWVVGRHDALRTQFEWQGGNGAVQRFAEAVEVPWSEHDRRALTAAEQERVLTEFLREDRARGFELDRPPLLRLALHRCGETAFRLTWTFHHALLDGRSYATLLEEVFAAHERFRAGVRPVAPAPRKFEEYLRWRAGLDARESETFWRGELQGFAAPTPLAVTGLGTAAELAVNGTQCDAEVRLAPATTAALQELAAGTGVSLGTVVHAAWGLLLARYSGEDDIVFGTIRAGRKATVPGADEMVGIFINAVPLRLRYDAEATLESWLNDIRTRWLAIRPHELTPLVHVQGWSEVPAGRALFDSLLVYEHEELEQKLRRLGGAWQHRRVRLYEQTNYPITLAAYGGTELCLRLQYDPSRFADATVRRMLGHLRTLLEQMPARRERPIGELTLLTSDEERQLLHEWNTPVRRFPPGATLVDLFEAQAARAPDREAVTCGEVRLSYRELNERANAIAGRLRARGIGPEAKVGLFIERSADLVIGLLGILKAGAAYVPIDTSYPGDRIDFMVNDAQLAAVVTESKQETRFATHERPIVSVDREPGRSAINPASGARATNLAYIIYTSGSTGRPKGVQVTHHNVVRLFEATEHWYRFKADDVWTLFHSAAFDFSVWEIWGALLYGGRLVVVPYLVSRAPDLFFDLIARERVTVLNQTPSAFRQLMEVDATQVPPRELALRFVIFGGEALEVASLRSWFERRGDQQPRLVNMYGITETTVHVTYRPLSRADLEGGSVIGERIPDLKLYVLDPQLRPVPVGVAGELFVGGAGLARGYLNRPELTAERFIVSPFEAGERLYRTGDRGRFLPTGDIEYLGRLDHQVKIRGFRVELGEIENALCQHPAVRAAVVIPDHDPVAGARLVAYLLAAGAERPGKSELREHLARRLPDYMLPAVQVWLERFPLTGNGKVDRRALPKPEPASEPVGAEHVAARSPTEIRLAEVWRGVLRLERVSVTENFFEAGGNSFLMVQLLARLRAAGFAAVQIPDLFQYPTIEALAAFLDRKQSAAAAPDNALNPSLVRARRQASALRGPPVLAR